MDKVEGEYKRFELTDDGISPRAKLGMDNGVFWNTGDESDEYGECDEYDEYKGTFVTPNYSSSPDVNIDESIDHNGNGKIFEI